MGLGPSHAATAPAEEFAGDLTAEAQFPSIKTQLW